MDHFHRLLVCKNTRVSERKICKNHSQMEEGHKIMLHKEKACTVIDTKAGNGGENCIQRKPCGKDIAMLF